MVVSQIKRAALVAALCSVALPVMADDERLDTEITVFGGYRVGGEIEVDESNSAYEADDAGSFGIIWNTRHSAETQWEVYFSQQDLTVKLDDPLLVVPSIDLEMYTLQLGGTYLFNKEPVQPYLSLTVGATHVDSDADSGDSDTFVSASMGLGLRFRHSERLGFRLEGRAHGIFISESSRIFCTTGPDENLCAVQADGDMFGQFEAFAGVTFRF